MMANDVAELTVAPVAPGLASELSLAVVRLARHLRLHRTQSAVTLSELSALTVLQRDGPMTVGDLATNERISAASVTRSMNNLVRDGLVNRLFTKDRRMVVVELSTRGHEVMASEAAAQDEWLNRRLAELSTEERAVLSNAAAIMKEIVE